VPRGSSENSSSSRAGVVDPTVAIFFLAPDRQKWPRVWRDDRHFRIESETLRYLEFLPGREAGTRADVEAYIRKTGLFTHPTRPSRLQATRSAQSCDVEPRHGRGPAVPAGRVGLRESADASFAEALPTLMTAATVPAVTAPCQLG